MLSKYDKIVHLELGQTHQSNVRKKEHLAHKITNLCKTRYHLYFLALKTPVKQAD
ncbi:MAG: hypothetical protein ACI9XO_003773, partial [Paraglaciecola sp.]